jgi:small subunit ribosomal protein S6
MKDYEVIFLVKPNLADERYKSLTEKLKSIITENDGEITSEKIMGMRELPQELSKQKKAYYVYVEFKAEALALQKMKHYFAVTEDIFRNMIVLSESVRKQTSKPRVVKVEVPTEA